MKRTITAIIALIIAVAALQAQELQHFTLDVKDFTELKVTDGINVDYICNADSAGMVVFDSTPSLGSFIMFEPSDGKLIVQLASREYIPTDLPTVTVYSRYLASVENDGDSLVRVLKVAPGPKFKARLVGNGRLAVRNIEANEVNVSIATGNGSIVIGGSADVAKLNVTGTGSITADQLKARDVRCRLSGTGTIGCFADKLLNVKGVGTGRVFYLGSPELKNKSIGIKVEKL